MGSQRLANSLNPASTKPVGRCGQGYIVCHMSAPENVAWAVSPRFLLALAARINSFTAHCCLAAGLPLNSLGAKASNIVS